MLEKRFKAAVLEKNNSKLAIKDILFSDELKKGQIFVKLKVKLWTIFLIQLQVKRANLCLDLTYMCKSIIEY